MGPERSIISVEMERAEPLKGSRLGELYVRHAPDGIRLAYLLTGDRALAEDLVQEAFARFVGRLLHLRSPEAFEPYLRRTIVNLCRSHFRRRRVERAYLERLALAPKRPADERHDRWFAAACSRRSARCVRRPCRVPTTWSNARGGPGRQGCATRGGPPGWERPASWPPKR